MRYNAVLDVKATKDSTREGSNDDVGDAPAEPGVVWVLVDGRPALRAQPLAGGTLVLGRDELDDERVSRRHAEVSFAKDGWRVRDLGSRNGTFVDGVALEGTRSGHDLGVVRIGHSLALLVRDCRPLANARVSADDEVVGPTLGAAFAAVARAGAAGQNLLLMGESGTGKELAARRFHAAGSRAAGPFVAVNCAAIPHGIAERLLFGAKRGAYSGADADAPGHVQAADGGVLFLDEIGELDVAVQAKLLRLLESKEVSALGSARPRRVDVTFCFATHRNLRVAVADGRLRADLYYRIVEPEVVLPPLRARREEIPWLIAKELGRARLQPHVGLVEACLLRPWPGNVRELCGAIRAAAERTRADGAAGAVVKARALAPDAGLGLAPPTPQPVADAGAAEAAPKPRAAARPARELDAAEIEAAIAAADGNVAAAARELGLHRTQLYRMMARAGVRGRGGS
jgi:transcriptional regulator with GAF, ATPase, and Fis domain